MDCWVDPQGEIYRLAENVSPEPVKSFSRGPKAGAQGPKSPKL